MSAIASTAAASNKRVKTDVPAPMNAAVATARSALAARIEPRIIDPKNPLTEQNRVNKWAPYLHAGNNGFAAAVLIYLDPQSGAKCTLSCKHWHVLRTSNAVSRMLINTHFCHLFLQRQDSLKVEGTYWDRYRAYGEIYLKRTES
jgi:hypothetical protein